MKKPIDRKYEIGLSFFEGIGPIRYRSLTAHFGSASGVFTASKSDLQKSGLTERFINKFTLFRQETNLDTLARDILNKNIQVLIQDDLEYPELLREIPDAPFILYARGNVSHLRGELPIGVVGTRRPTRYGIEMTKTFTEQLVQAGCTIISGMAMGVDAVAHTVALNNDGKTVAVLGCGVDICYPAINRPVYDRLKKDGLIISEFPPGMKTSKGVFPSRNRIIAGLSRGVLVTEGTDKSGSLITARNAADYGRDVFAIPSPLTSPMGMASLILIQQGARAVGSADDILQEYSETYRHISQKAKALSLETLSSEEQRVIGFITQEGSAHVDSLVRTVALSSAEVLAIVSRLEISGVVSEVEDGVYALRT
ncbi:DNA-protecting protein DprA [Candidatus Roizmanbacteria bacterium]|nr:DNA-protecting protein DprA [Candidatus Roizmanbacteria bacterium]